MKVKQVVEMKFNHAYTGWNCLEFNDQDGNEVSIRMSEDDYLSLEESIVTKCNRIRKERAEKAAELVKDEDE